MQAMPQASSMEPDMYFIVMTDYVHPGPPSILPHGVSGVHPFHHKSKFCKSGQQRLIYGDSSDKCCCKKKN